MDYYSDAGASRNNSNLPTYQPDAPPLTNGGKVIKRSRPQLSVSLCNAIAALAGLGTELRHG